MKSDYIWMDGELVPFAQATVHFLSPTLHYGMGVFEGIRCYQTSKGPAVFRLREHMKRFLDSVQIVGIQHLPYTMEELIRAVHLTIRVNNFTECYIRPLVFMEGPLGLNSNEWRSRVGIAVWEWGAFHGQGSHEKGVRMMVSSLTRHHPNVMMTKAKAVGNYVNSIMAKTMAANAGFDEAAMLDPQGYVAECTGENLFLVRNGVIYTPPRTTVLEGVTRDAVITLAQDAGIKVEEEQISRDQLYIADEVFLSGTAAEVVPVREIDFRVIGNGKAGPITGSLQQVFYQTVCGQGIHSADWLDYADEAVHAV